MAHLMVAFDDFCSRLAGGRCDQPTFRLGVGRRGQPKTGRDVWRRLSHFPKKNWLFNKDPYNGL